MTLMTCLGLFLLTNAVPFHGERENPDMFTEYVLQREKFCEDKNPCHRNYLLYDECKPCMCDQACAVFGDCCPHRQHVTSGNATLAGYTCMNAVSRNVSAVDWIYLAVDQCLLPDANSSLKRLCEAPYEDVKSFTGRPPVTSSKTYRSYRNSFCAECNREFSYVPWKVSLECSADWPGIFQVTSLEELESIVSRSDQCYFRYQGDYRLPAQACHQGELPSGCNFTDHGTRFDNFTFDFCLAFISAGRRFRNHFYYTGDSSFTNDFMFSGKVLTPLSVLIDFRSDRRSTRKTPRCSEDFVYDPFMKICRKLYCSPSLLFNGSQCVHIFPSVQRVRYLVYFSLFYDPGSKLNSTDDVKELMYQLFHVLDSIITDHGGTLGFCVLRTRWHLTEAEDKMVQNHCTLIKTNIFFEIKVLSKQQSKLIETGLLSIQEQLIGSEGNKETLPKNIINPNMNIWKTVLFSRQNAMAITPTICDLELGETDDNEFPKNLFLSKLSGKSQPDRESYLLGKDLIFNRNILAQIPEQKLLYWTNKSNYYNLTTMVFQKHLESKIKNFTDYIQLTHLRFCSQVELNVHEILLDPEHQWMVIKVSGANLTSSQFNIVDNDTARVCSSVFPENYTATNTSLHFYFQGVVSFVCSCLSLLGIAITFFTYCLFRELRTLPGLNSMGLLGTVFTAQALFQFGTGQTESGRACVAIGILTHFFWLATFGWMNVCCFHMHKVFTRLLLHPHLDNRSVLLTWLRYAVYSFGVSGTIVALTVAVNLGTVGDTGYGRSLCYISSPAVVGVAFASPLALVLITNVFFLTKTIHAIHTTATSALLSQPQNRNIVAAYVKLSALSGLTWIFGFFAVFANIEALAYLFIVSNASLGLVLFVCFVCNQQVYKLYRARLTVRLKSYLSSTGDTSIPSISSSRNIKLQENTTHSQNSDL